MIVGSKKNVVCREIYVMKNTHRYPKKSHYLRFCKSGDDVRIKHILTEEEFLVSSEIARYIKALDGTRHPYKLQLNRDKADAVLDFMEEEELFEDGERIKYLGIGRYLCAVWIPGVKHAHRVVGTIWNHLLMVSWLPILLIGAHVAYTGNYVYVDGEWGNALLGLFGGILVGLVLHEVSHAAATLNYRGFLSEVGIMMQTFMPGVYCLVDYDNVKDRFKRAQINAAGVECNMLLAGVFLVLLKLAIFPSYFLIYAAVMNCFLGMTNMSLIGGVDGAGTFEEYFGCENFVARAKALVSNRKEKAKLRRSGINGSATIAACYMICAWQLLYPLIYIMSAVNIICAFII